MQSANNQGTSAYDSVAEVRRVEGDTAWVHIAGGVDETPVKLTIAAKAGDTVQVRVGGGQSVKDFNRLNKLEEGNIVTQRALLALLAHGIDGNDIEAMRKAKAELTDYLIER